MFESVVRFPRTSAAAMFLLALTLAACTTITNSTSQTVTGSGTLKTETRTVTGFSRIDLRTHGNVNVSIGDTESLVISADDNFLPLLETTVQNGWLVITTPNYTNLAPVQPLVFTVTVTSLSDVTLSGSGTISVTGVSASALSTILSGSGNISVAGTADRQTVEISGSGIYDGSDLESSDAVVNVTGSGNAVINASGTLDAKITGSGLISYSGGATVTQ